MTTTKPSGTPQPPRVLIVGETLVDILHRADGDMVEKPGGSCANVAIALGRLDRVPRLFTMLGDDKHGREARTWLEDSGVVVQAQPAPQTSTATARLDASGAASYDFVLDWDLAVEETTDVDALHIGSIASVLEPGASAVSRFVDRHRTQALVTYDPNIRPGVIDDEDAVRQRVLSFIERSDVVKASDEDIAWLHPGQTVEAVARRWATLGPALVVVTSGAEGSLAVTKRTVIRGDAVSVEVADTVGAGDTFMGALIDGLIAAGAAGHRARQVILSLDGAQLAALLHQCARAAAITVSRPGANPPTRRELEPVSR